MHWNRHRVLVAAPQGLDGSALVIAADRAGGLGILDVTQPGFSIQVIQRMLDFGVRSFALRVLPDRICEEWVLAAGSRLIAVICAYPRPARDLEIACSRIHGFALPVVFEVVSATQATAALAAGADGLIAVGNEAGGLVGRDSLFMLLQSVLSLTNRPVWARGGIGPRVAAGCIAAGAAGVVLEGAVMLARESPLLEEHRAQLSAWDGSESVLIESDEGFAVRVYAPPRSPILDRFRSAAKQGRDTLSPLIEEKMGWAADQAWPAGQDAAFAAGLARRYVSVGGIVQATLSAVAAGIDGALKTRPLAENSPLARSHGTSLPILQGPMTRVSDVASFAETVAREGGLPFLALALLRRPEIDSLLAETSSRLSGRPWGVGLLGFAPAKLRQEQLAAVRSARPPFALIAGGRPGQAAELERDGITTYLHVPSPGLLDQYLRAGARRFVLEGRECGGHVGPRSSFILWEQACRVLDQAIEGGVHAEALSVVFAGGIHDARSAAAVAGLAGDLTDRGVKIGILMGTAYLFTREVVATGAIVKQFQDEALRCRETVLLDTGPGHQVRVSSTPFVDRFRTERNRLLSLGMPHEEVRESLERLNLGRLRIAAKGVGRGQGANSPLVMVTESDQAADGLYMLGQVAVLRDQVMSMSELHRDVSVGATARIEKAGVQAACDPRPKPNPSAIAIVGMAAVFPGAKDIETFWSNSLGGVDAITEVPADRWDWRLYYDPDPKAPDKICSKWGGFLPDVLFDPLRYGMPPASIPSIEPAQLLALEVARAALADAGYAERSYPRERTAVVLGMGGGAAQLAMGYAFRSYLPMLDSVIPGAGRDALARCQGLLPEWTEDSFPGFLLNVTSGRIANRLDLGGANYTVDAACGSSLAALNLAVRELKTGAADLVILGGVDTVQNPFTYLAFSKTQAFSPRGRCRPFDACADGIVISEGVGAVILKRLADAERDGDRIYAVIQGIGSSSDGRCRGLTAPGNLGQLLTLKRAYAEAGIDPATVGYIEAHGTGTAVGDVVEIDALSRLLHSAGAKKRSCVVGSVKSQIGHTKCAAGLAGLIHATLALHHRAFPPTIGIEAPNPQLNLEQGPLRLNTQARPWLHSALPHPRRAGVSAFGFGGTNFHVVLESYEGDPIGTSRAPIREWPAELLTFSAPDHGGLLRDIDHLAAQLAAGARPTLRGLAHALAMRPRTSAASPTLAIVAASHEDLSTKLNQVREALRDRTELFDPRGIYFAEAPAHYGGGVAFLFPGQGSQAVGMLGDLAILFDDVRRAYEEFDAAILALGREPIGSVIFPPPAFDEPSRREQSEALRATEVAQPALGAASVGLLRLFSKFGLEPDMLGGHSYGELVALYAAGVLDTRGLAELSHARGWLLREAGGEHPGSMAALSTGPESVPEMIADQPEVLMVNYNGPLQTVIAGPSDALEAVLSRARARQIHGRILPVACAFHTPRMEPAREPLTRLAGKKLLGPPARPVFSNLDAAIHPPDPQAIAIRLGDHVTHPVRFAEMVAAIYDQGARVFVEVGPGGLLTPLVESILGNRPHLAVASDVAGRPGLVSLLHALARLVVAGVPVRLDSLTRGRSSGRIDLAALPKGDGSPAPSPSCWVVNGSRARPLAAPEPRRLGQSPALSATAPSIDLSLDTHSVGPTRLEPLTRAKERNGSTVSRSTLLPSASQVISGDRAPGDTDRALTAFQETMRIFLEVQRTTMLAYLSGGQPSPLSDAAGQHPDKASTPEPASSFSVGRVPDSPGPLASRSPASTTPPEPKERPAPAPPGREEIARTLLEIVRERTGYPIEVLRLELDLEADLGIDSIKRVEILGKLRDAFPQLAVTADAETTENLSSAMTLAAIVDRAERTLGKASESVLRATPSPVDHVPINGRRSGKAPGATRRLLLEAADCPLGDLAAGLMPGGTVLITEDGRGVAETLAARIKSRGWRVALLGRSGTPIDWTSPASVESAVRRSRSGGPLVGLVHLLPLRGARHPEIDPAAWADRMVPEVRGLFHLAKATAAELEEAATCGGSCLIAATAMGGYFASNGAGAVDFFPGHGAVAGLLKTLAREWSSVRTRVVDVDASALPDQLAEQLLAEVFHEDGWSEVGYAKGRRIRLRMVPAPLPVDQGQAAFQLAPGEPVLITGGARGITSLVAAELARRWRPTLLLIGTTPPSFASDEMDGLSGPSELKRALYERLSRGSRVVSPKDLEQAFQSLRRSREIRQTLDRLRALGSRVEYAQADVRNPGRLSEVLAQWRSRFGEPVGLIHGAAVIRDKLIKDKSASSFDRVLGTKLDGALNLVRLLRPEHLRFTILFSSIAGRFGNRGQSDYAAANEVLNKLAIWLDRRTHGRVVAPIWGPWSGIGMVSDLEIHLDAQGLGMISPEVGVAALLDELMLGRKGEVEVIIAGDLGKLDAPLARAQERVEALG
jgi:acyl transferase domain-containing protein/NAD(P)H-dependent flavin oxidoreductase YrpB (nitropropane dioxygenase family)/NAD(P)-dependent dehydrogenase (short-subunit alcohol dehydrogenase family)